MFIQQNVISTIKQITEVLEDTSHLDYKSVFEKDKQ